MFGHETTKFLGEYASRPPLGGVTPQATFFPLPARNLVHCIKGGHVNTQNTSEVLYVCVHNSPIMGFLNRYIILID